MQHLRKTDSQLVIRIVVQWAANSKIDYDRLLKDHLVLYFYTFVDFISWGEDNSVTLQ